MLNNSSLQRRFAFFMAFMAIASGIATVALITDTAAVQARVDELRWLLMLDGILLLLLSIVVAKRVISLWLARHRGVAGA